MSGTIESINHGLRMKLNSLHEVITLLSEKNLPKLKQTNSELIEITRDYEMGSIKMLTDYFLFLSRNEPTNSKELRIAHNKTKLRFHKEFHMFIRKENFVSRMNKIHNTIKYWLSLSALDANEGISRKQLLNLVSQYENTSITHEVNVMDFNKCQLCDKEMSIISTTSELVCTKCGRTELLTGTVFDDEQFYYQEGQRTKHGAYEPSKHCKFWIDSIQAKESKDIPEKVLNAVKECIKRNKVKNSEEITCKEIRRYLRQTRFTSFNENVPLIRKLVTGISPPQLSDRETQLIILYFNKVIRIYEEIKPPGKTNVPYHPYLIYKIIEHIMKEDRVRAKAILSCIHLQSRETLIENDIMWRSICERLKDIKYIPTDRNADLTS